jgi:ABC-type hemin transport system substrate-binding protein
LALGAVDRLVAVDEGSRSIPQLGHLPVTDLASARSDFAADLILVDEIGLDDSVERRARAEGAQVFAVQPHDLEDVVALARAVGATLLEQQEVNRYERELLRPLALVAGTALDENRPRALGLVGFEPLELAGGHSFETDLIQIAGATSMTHGGDETRELTSIEGIHASNPDILIVISREPLAPAKEAFLRSMISGEIRLLFFEFDRDDFWLEDAEVDALRLRQLLFPSQASSQPVAQSN